MDTRNSADGNGEQTNALKRRALKRRALNRELERCDREIAKATATLLSGYPDIDGALLWLYDWRCERRLIEQELDRM